MRLIILSLLILSGTVFFEHSAHALSCERAELTEQAIKTLPIIFEGTVTQIDKPGVFQKHSKLKTQIYTFHITKLWKGDYQDKTVRILAPPGWAMDYAYELNKNYLVFGSYHDDVLGKEDLFYSSPGWCGYDLNGKDENIKTLQRLLTPDEQDL